MKKICSVAIALYISLAILAKVEDRNIHYVDLEVCELRSDDHLHFNGNGCREAADIIFGKIMDLGLAH